MENLRVGDISSDGQVEIIAEDKLCFLVKSQSKGATGIRTISKALLSEYIQYFLVHPNDNANTAREALSGKTQIDKFEYGYSSTLTVMAKMALANSQNPNYNKCVLKYPLQQIYYGAPGTGKSYTINEVTKGVSSDFVFRTTFHPDSDYSTFVGAYKPTMRKVKNHVSLNLSIDDLAAELNVLYNNVDLGKVGGLQKFCFDYHMYMDGEHMTVNVKDLLRRAGFSENYSQEIDKYLKFYKLFPKQEEKIAYSFVAQSFLKAYVTAWQNREQAVYLVIEEINRGNCAQIFGDLFQLLDRKEDGVSEYPIKADQDMQDYLEEKFADCVGLPENIKSGDELQLPSNLYIWATMNTSDQSLFPIDSAFKRRWDWKYMPISKGVDKDGKEMNWSIVIGEKSYDWWKFLTAINEVIGTETQSEDKKLGFFFCKADAKDEISADKFVNKVLFYLWNDVFKTCGVEYHYKDGDDEKLLTFDKFHTKDGFDVKKIQDWLELDLKMIGIGKSGVLSENGKNFTYNVNGVSVDKITRIPYEAVKTFAVNNSDMSTSEIVDSWKKLIEKGKGNGFLYLVETKEERDARRKMSNDKAFDSKAIWLEIREGEGLYVSNQWDADLIKEFVEKVHSHQDLGIKIEKVEG